jgi:hypothetical protein
LSRNTQPRHANRLQTSCVVFVLRAGVQFLPSHLALVVLAPLKVRSILCQTAALLFTEVFLGLGAGCSRARLGQIELQCCGEFDIVIDIVTLTGQSIWSNIRLLNLNFNMQTEGAAYHGSRRWPDQYTITECRTLIRPLYQLRLKPLDCRKDDMCSICVCVFSRRR